MKGKHYPKSLSCSIACSRGTLPLTSPRRGSKLLKNKSQEPAGSDYPFFRPILHILFKACSIVSFQDHTAYSVRSSPVLLSKLYCIISIFILTAPISYLSRIMLNLSIG